MPAFCTLLVRRPQQMYKGILSSDKIGAMKDTPMHYLRTYIKLYPYFPKLLSCLLEIRYKISAQNKT